MYVWNIDSFETEYISTTMFLPKIIIALVTSVCTEMIFEGVNFWRQKEHFKEYSKYSYLSITSKDGKAETTEKMMLELINEKTKLETKDKKVYTLSGGEQQRIHNMMRWWINTQIQLQSYMKKQKKCGIFKNYNALILSFTC